MAQTSKAVVKAPAPIASNIVRRRSATRVNWRPLLVALVPVALVLGSVLVYYYQRYAAIIDAGLRGDIFVRSSGIYAAPLTLRVGAGMRPEALMQHLRQLGYAERDFAENEKRGSFIPRGKTVELHPSADSLIDNARAFQPLRVVFGASGIQAITDLQSGRQVQQAQIEPELISSVINPEREKRKIIEFKDLPPDLVNAITAIEDRQFFDHPGINWRGILRALIRDFQSGSLREGGSSITQQLVKDFFLTPERTPKRKLSEAYMSLILEQRLSKQEILAMYCNQIYLGQRGGFSINGFGQAARAYFGKDISNLQLHEAAMLAGLVRSPNYYSPYSHQDRALERRNLTLDKMVEAGKIQAGRADPAKRRDLDVIGKAEALDASDAPYFVDYLMRQLEAQFGDNGQSMRALRVYSTIDLDLQRAAYQAVTEKMREVERLVYERRGRTSGLQAALVAMNAQTGEILAMVGGRNYAQSQLNRATEARRQPGSVFKPFVYAAGLSADDAGRMITPALMFHDTPHTFDFNGKPYTPGNYGERYTGNAMTVRDALVHSKNVITVEIAERVGFAEVARFAERAGLPKVPALPSVALGAAEATPLQLASAYTSFANQGRRAAPIAVNRITTKTGQTMFEARTQTSEVMSPQVAYIMTSMMQDVLDYGTGTRVRQMGLRAPAAGKTGSSRDGWFAGYTPHLVCAVWIGFDDNADIGVTGGLTAAPIWADFMIRALQLRPELGGQFAAPAEGLVAMDIDPATGQPSSGGTGRVRHEIFLAGTHPGGDFLPEAALPTSAEPLPESDPAPIEPAPSTDDQRAPAPPVIDSGIPLPPGVQPRVGEPGATTPQPTPTPPKPSFGRKLAEFFGIRPKTVASATPEPRPPVANTPPRPAVTPRLDAPDETRPRRVEEPVPTPIVRSREVEAGPGLSADPADIADVAPTRPIATPRADSSRAATRNNRTTPQPTPAARNSAPATSSSAPSAPPMATPTPPAPTINVPSGRGDFLLFVCDETGQLPVRGCKPERRRFSFGKEPTVFCAKHKK